MTMPDPSGIRGLGTAANLGELALRLREAAQNTTDSDFAAMCSPCAAAVEGELALELRGTPRTRRTTTRNFRGQPMGKA